MSHAIDVDQLIVNYGDLVAVNEASLHVPFGRLCALLGPNGAGKTTLVETLLGFGSPTKGTVRLHGLDPERHHATVVASTGALLQRGGVWFPMTPWQVLRLTATYYVEPRDPGELIEALSLTSCARTPWRRLSGGEQQRTLLALSLIGRPKVLVLDEPTTAVDPEGRRDIRTLLRAERDRGCAILITTHELSEAEILADDVVVMHHGRVLSSGPLDQWRGDALVLEVDGEIDVAALERALGAPVKVDGRVISVATAASSEAVTAATNAVTALGLSLRSLRTRATLEERYLELIGDQRLGES